MIKRTIFLAIWFLLISSIANAEYWCQWDGSKGINCRSAEIGSQINLPNDGRITVEEAIANEHGYYKTTRTQPVFDSATHKRGAEIWGKVDNQISLTWEVVELTGNELTENTSRALSIESYCLMKPLLDHGVVQASWYSQKIRDAYVAQQTLGANCD